MAITLQSGLREYHGNLSQYTGMLGGLTPDVHTLKSLNPLTNNRVICVMYRGPEFMMNYLNPTNKYDTTSLFMTYKKSIEYYNTGIQCNFNSLDLASTQIKGGFAGRTINIPTQQNAQTSQSLTISTTELVGRPISTFHNMWIDGIADPITGLTTYHGLVAGSDESNNDSYTYKRIFTTPSSDAAGGSESEDAVSSDIAFEPSPAHEVAEFLIIVLDRSGARVEGAVAALGCIPQAKIGMDVFTYNSSGNSQAVALNLTYNCQFVQSSYINDLAARYVKQFAIFGNSYNFNPGAGDAFFKDKTADSNINTEMFNGGVRPKLDSVQSSVGNMPVFKVDSSSVTRTAKAQQTITPSDHFYIYSSETTETAESGAFTKENIDGSGSASGEGTTES